MSGGPAPATRGSVAERAVSIGLAVVLLLLGSLPLATWIPGGLTDPGYSRRWVEWGYGVLICGGAAIVAALVAGRRPPGESSPVPGRIHRWLVAHPTAADACIAAICCAVYIVIALRVFDARPLLIDEIVQVMQARMYASGALSTPTDSAPEFFSMLHVVDSGSRVYSQFPPGWAAMLAIGSLVGAEWLVGPLVGAVAVFVFARLLRWTYGSTAPWIVSGGALAFGLAPFVAFQFASHMSHGPFVMWFVLTAWLATPLFSASDAAEDQSVSRAVALGAAAGMAFAVRPLDGLALVVPLFGALGWMVLRRRISARLFATAAAGAFVPLALVMYVNVRTTGSATTFGYEALWGASHGLGFHQSPWGDAHTPQRGLELLSLYVTRLNSYLFESPFPSLLPVVLALLMRGPWSTLERFLLVVTGVHAALYFAYWHDGFYLGPRFVLPWVPALLLLSIRSVSRLGGSRASPRVRAATAGAMVSGVVLIVVVGVPVRVSQYRAGLASMRTDYSAEARRAGVTDALVFVRESWGAQLIARLWALRVSRPATATLYSRVDACVLEHAVTALERAGKRSSEAESALMPLLIDSARVRASTVSPDTTERMLPGATYDSLCTARVVADREGYALLPPLLLEQETGNVYVRDFQERDSIIAKRYPGRRHYLLRRDGVDGSAPLVWTRLPAGRRD